MNGFLPVLICKKAKRGASVELKFFSLNWAKLAVEMEKTAFGVKTKILQKLCYTDNGFQIMEHRG